MSWKMYANGKRRNSREVATEDGENFALLAHHGRGGAATAGGGGYDDVSRPAADGAKDGSDREAIDLELAATSIRNGE